MITKFKKLGSASLIAVLLSGLSSAISADDAPAGVTLTPATEKSPLVQKIPAGTQKGEVMTFPALPVPDHTAVVLKVNMRLADQRPGGWGHHAAIHFNGGNIGEHTPDGQPRLLGRSSAMQTTHPKEKSVKYFRGNDSYHYILLLTGPENSDVVDSRVVSPKKAAYDYYFDVTDLVKRDSDNTVRFTNHLPARFHLPMLVKDVQLFTVSADKLPQLRGTASAAAAKNDQQSAGHTPATEKSAVAQRIPAGGKGAVMTFPAIHVPEGMSVVLRFNMRLVSPRPSGWGHYASLHLNGRNITALTAQKLPRMLERGGAMLTTHPKEKSIPWFRAGTTYGYILTLFGPENSEKVDGRITSPTKAGYVYDLDVTDLIRGDGDNTLQFTNHLPTRFGNELLVKDVQFFLVPVSTMPGLRGVDAPAGPPELNAPMTPATPRSAVVQRVQPGGGKGELITFPALRVPDDMAVVLKANLRLLSPAPGGWGQYAAITLNGKKLGMLNTSGMPRLLGRGNAMQTTLLKEKTVSWYRPANGYDCILTCFGPENSEEIDPRVIEPRHQGYNYYFDVSDLVNREIIGADNRIESEGSNVLQFFNHLASKYPCPLLVKDVQFFFVPRSKMLELCGVKLREFDSQAPAACSFKNDSWQLDVTRGGGIRITSNGENSFIESEYSYPAVPAMKFHVLGTGPADDKDLSVTVKQISSDKIEVVADTPLYRVTRMMTEQGHRVQVSDTITNKSSRDLGMIWQHFVGYNQIPSRGAKLAGQSNSTQIKFFGSCNPTIFVRHRNSAVALAAEDTVSRAQMILNNAANCFSMGTEGLGIGVGKSIRLDWLIYPFGGNTDYFDFINQLRRDWNVNKTVIGPYKIHASVIPGIKFQIASVPPWYQYGEGSLLSDEEYMKKVQGACDRLRKACPGVKLLAQLETNLVPFDAGQYPWGKELPLTYGNRKDPRTRYAQFTTADLTGKIESVSPYKDSLIRDAAGNAMIDNYYVYQPIPLINLMVQPERGNYRYKRFFEQIDFLMDKAGFDGVYIDQFIPYIVGGFSEDRWDGCTVVLDESGKIKSKRYSYAIAGAPARADIVKYVIRKGGHVVTNGHPISREEQTSGVLSFQEMENDLINPVFFMDQKPPECRWQAAGHLASPIILGLRPPQHQQAVTDGRDRRAEILTKGIVTALRNGQLHYYYSTEIPQTGPYAGGFELSNRMFPFTPVELHEGYLIGKERIITAISGVYTVSGRTAPLIHRFNLFGNPVEPACKVSGTPGNWQVECKLNDWNEVVVIEVQD